MAPVTAEENTTSGRLLRLQPTDTPMAEPTTGEVEATISASGASQAKRCSCDSCERIRPMINEEKSPSAMELMAWIK